MTLLSDLASLQLGRQFSAITADSRKVTDGALFLAYPGAVSDGRDYIAQAIQAGAMAVVWEKADFAWHADWNVANVAVSDLKQQAGQLAAEFYQYPSSQMSMIGVTGTNGKTSVSQWLAQCLSVLGKKAAVLGTIGNGIVSDGGLAVAANTTPDAILLQGMLADFVRNNVDAVVMEVSSHGLDQNRVNGVEFDVAVLTNLSRDHLDYHETMEAYAAAKQKLFVDDGLKMRVLNADDVFGQALVSIMQAQGKAFITYGLQGGDVRGENLQLLANGLSMHVTSPQGNAQLTAPVLGRFNAYNVLAVLATLLALGIGLQDALAAIANLKPVQGRMQQFGGGALPLVVIDYAHTPDALEKVLSTLREQLQGTQRLLCVFGCGGDRDAGKRPLMGAVASQLSDALIVTSDNPRSENPDSIIGQIVHGLNVAYQIEVDREHAIQLAVSMAKSGDIVLVAGKGHEDYQEISGVKTPFSDAQVAQAALAHYQQVEAAR
ncbi:UDP-N-acetylmuramoyl-L-alanyl-D-glutamate--2,6-diaminopimelate ligase [mine drainage metagenome]|uniref:UDP-N-acetylmuramoyl-L-alanyl-D-glutamate--2, 6-diaminopimelate ligase n=1 Tax=mine drainage metagenome TaxID=410659 RepID=A0A1J5SRM5_9ZZZZ